MLQQNSEYVSKFYEEEIGRISPIGITSLMVAAASGNIELVQFIAKNCPDLIGKTDYSGKSAFIYACETLSTIIDEK